jgi:hypothetical protein
VPIKFLPPDMVRDHLHLGSRYFLRELFDREGEVLAPFIDE